MHNILERLKNRIFPNAQQKIYKLWFAHGGDERFRYDYDLTSKSLVLDLGGYEGQWSDTMFRRYGCRIIIFEPVARFASQIRCRFSDIDHIEVLQFGLGSGTRKETIHVNANSTSMFKAASETEVVNLVDVKTWFDQQQIEQVDLMKINIEGGEFELLERMIDTGLVDRIDNIQVQFHDFAPAAESRMARIQSDLAITHRLTWQYRFVWENWQRLGI